MTTAEDEPLLERLRQAETAAKAMARALGDLNWCHPAWEGDSPRRTVSQANEALHLWERYSFGRLT